MALDPVSRTSSNALDTNVQGSSFTPINTTSDPYGFNSSDLNTSASSFTQTAAVGPNLQIITPNSNVVQNRMVFSTVRGQVRPSKTLTLRNTGNETLTISSLRLGDSLEKGNAVTGRLVDHQRAADFKVIDPRTGQPITQPINLAANQSINLPVQFRPQRTASLTVDDSPTHTLNGENYASLTINSNDADGPIKVNLAGLNAANYESDFEASLAEITRSFGFTTDIGSEDNKLGVTNTLFGDEVYSPYWVRADSTKPVELFPIAVYSSRTDTPHDGVSFRYKNATKDNFLYGLAGSLNDDNIAGSNDQSGGENQKLLPKILVNGVNTMPTSSMVDFSPSSPFVLKRGDGSTNDSQNGAAKTRAWRIYPLKGANGVVVPNTWLASTDIGTNVGRNGDFNDVVYIFKNARPESRTASSSVSSLAASSSDLTFNTTSANTPTNTSTQLNRNATAAPIVSEPLSSISNTLNLTTTNVQSSNNTLNTPLDNQASKDTILTKLDGSQLLRQAQFYAGEAIAQDSKVSNVISNPLLNSLTALTSLPTGQNSIS